jgi:cardiolipin synthase
VSEVAPVLSAALVIYALLATGFIIFENRRPQATLAWILVFFFAPGIGLLIYILFGRDRKAFSRQSRLLRQNLEATAGPSSRRCCPARMQKSPGSRAAAPAAGS